MMLTVHQDPRPYLYLLVHSCLHADQSLSQARAPGRMRIIADEAYTL